MDVWDGTILGIGQINIEFTEGGSSRVGQLFKFEIGSNTIYLLISKIIINGLIVSNDLRVGFKNANLRTSKARSIMRSE